MINSHLPRQPPPTAGGGGGGGGGSRRSMKHTKQQHADLNFMSKRKVPNGPDPVHNRRKGDSHRSPGRD
ncbi:unnamed protein product [Cuscuta campestris]|nr:unnamed protein product [Cuscuta campestris]